MVLVLLSSLILTPVVASAQYTDSVSDPEGDVFYWKETEDGYRWRENVERPNIDITSVNIEESGGGIEVSLEVKGVIHDDPGFHYQMSLEDGDGGSYGISFNNGDCYLEWPNGFKTLEYSGVSTSTFQTSFSLDEVDNPSHLEISETITHNWLEEEGEGEYYQDTAGPDAEDPDGSGSDGETETDEEFIDKIWTGGLLCLAVAIIVPLLIVVIIVVILIKVVKSEDEKEKRPPQQQYQ